MKIDFSEIVLDINGQPILVPVEGQPEPAEMSLRFAVVHALLGNFEDERTLTGPQKLERWQLAKRVQDAREALDIKAEEVATIKGLVGKSFSTAVCAPVLMLLDPT